MAGINKKNTLWVLLLAVCCGCGSKELTIEPIREGCYPHEGYVYRGDIGDVKGLPCIDWFRFYTIANYERIVPDSLYDTLNAYINPLHLYEKYVENSQHNNRTCIFIVDFYEKSLFANYEKYIYEALRDETGGISKYRNKSVARIYAYRYRGVTTLNTVLYNKGSMFSDLSIRWKKIDTVLVQPEYRY